MEYKVLKYGNIFVDVNLLEKGIYATNIPSLYKEDETIENLTSRFKALSKALNISDSYFENLNQCSFVKVELKEI